MALFSSQTQGPVFFGYKLLRIGFGVRRDNDKRYYGVTLTARKKWQGKQRLSHLYFLPGDAKFNKRPDLFLTSLHLLLVLHFRRLSLGCASLSRFQPGCISGSTRRSDYSESGSEIGEAWECHSAEEGVCGIYERGQPFGLLYL